MDPATLPDTLSDDALLLRCYVREGSEAAFRALAERHLPLVWSVARRMVNGDAALADDVAQSVLADFGAKAHTLPPDMPASGWLHRHTVFTATKAVRSQSRRRAREQMAALETSAPDSMNAHSDTWTELAPHVDAALDRLRTAEREAIVLRYYEKRPLREVGRALGTTEEAARKRIDRALGKLRAHLQRRGVVPALAILSALLRDESVAAPPAAVARRIMSGAWGRLESGALPAAASKPWWQRRSAVAGAVAALVAGLLWFAWKSDWFGGDTGHQDRQTAADDRNHRAVPAEAESSPSVTFTATLMMLPEKSVLGRLMHYEPGNDESLYRELLSQAAALQKQVKPEETFATTGHALVILSGPAKPHHLIPEQPGTPVHADPFASPRHSLKSPPAPSIKLQRHTNFSYPTEFDFDAANGRVVPNSDTIRNAGTMITANVSPPDEDGNYLIECSLDHMFAPPEQELWHYRWPDGQLENANDVVQQPVFHNTQWKLSPVSVRPAEIILAGMMRVPPDLLPDDDNEPRRLLLFFQLQP